MAALTLRAEYVLPMETVKDSSIGVIESMHQSPLTQFRLSSELSDKPARMGMRIVVCHQTFLSFLLRASAPEFSAKYVSFRRASHQESSKKEGSVLARALAGWDAVRVWTDHVVDRHVPCPTFLSIFFGNEDPHHLILLHEMFCVHNVLFSRVTYNRRSCG